MTNFSHGQAAEAAAVEYLGQQGFKILEQNYRTRYCEIDIVAGKGKVIYFVEVKYRMSNAQGTGLDYITPKKLNQMKFAAKMWAQEHDRKGDYELSAIEVSGLDYKITNFLPEL